MKRTIAVCLMLSMMIVICVSCGSGAAEKETAPAEELTIDVGSMGLPVAITGVMAGSPYRIAFALAAQPFGLITNSDRIQHLSDITSEDQIGLPNINSVQHILLAMAAKAELGDAHALDGNLTNLSNPDGYSAIVSGAVACHLALSPYNFMELASNEVSAHEVEIGEDVWPVGNTVIVSVVSESLKNDRTELYDALMAAVEEAKVYIDENPEKVAEMLTQDYDAPAEEILKWISDERSSYDSELHGVMDMADFMVEEGFLEKGPASFSDLTYDDVKGD